LGANWNDSFVSQSHLIRKQLCSERLRAGFQKPYAGFKTECGRREAVLVLGAVWMVSGITYREFRTCGFRAELVTVEVHWEVG
jgi:hypothetical protein